MRDVIVTLLVFGLLPSMLLQPHIGVLVWTWIGIMNPHRLGWGFAYSFPFAAVVGAVTMVALLVSKEPKRLPVMPATVVLILFVLWMNITTLFAINSAEAWTLWDKVMKIQLMVFITLMIMRQPERIRMLTWVTAMSLGFYGVKGGIYTITTGGGGMVLGPPGSFIEGNTEISLALIMILPLLRYLQLNSENKWIRRGLGIAMLLTAVSIVGSYSRGALVAGLAMGAFLWLKSRNKAATGMAIALVIPLLFAFMPEQWHDKMGTIKTYEEDRSALGRINAWYFAFNLANAHPITGGGFEAFTPELFQQYAPEPENFHDSHSIYFQVLGEHGYVGLFLFLTLLILAWRAGSQTIQLSRDRPELKWASELAAMTQVSLIGYAVGGAFLGLAYFDFFYELVILLVLTRAHVDSALAPTGELATSAPKIRKSFVQRDRKPSGEA